MSSGITSSCWLCLSPFSSCHTYWHGGLVASASYWQTALIWASGSYTACFTYTIISNGVGGNLCEACCPPLLYCWHWVPVQLSQQFLRFPFSWDINYWIAILFNILHYYYYYYYCCPVEVCDPNWRICILFFLSRLFSVATAAGCWGWSMSVWEQCVCLACS